MISKISFLLLLAIGSPALAKSFLIGHNIAITTDVPEKGTATFGSYLFGYSPTDSCHIATSPWMAWNYNSYSLMARCRTTEDTEYFKSSALQLGYIKSDDSLGTYYRQDFAILWWAIENQINEIYTIYTTLNYMYFWDETFPMSLRREPGNDQPWQLTISTLHQIHWTPSMGFQIEIGILGLNYATPLIHSGYSFYKTWESVLLQIGVSISASPNNFDRLYSRTSTPERTIEGYDYSVHPEIQLQYFF